MPTPIKMLPRPPLLPMLRRSRLALPLALLAAAAMLFISESSFRSASDTIVSLRSHSTTRTSVQDLRRALTDAETGQRGYLLVGQPAYLGPYTSGIAAAWQALAELDGRFHDDPEAASVMVDIGVATRAKLAELAETIRLHDSGDEDGWRRILTSDLGQQQMDKVRALATQLVSIEEQNADEERAQLRRTLQVNRVGVASLTALCLLAIFMYLRQTGELVRQREERRQLVQIERDQLEGAMLQRTAHLTELARHLQSVREDERHRLARELHDELGALLTAAKLDVARLKSRLGSVTPEVAERLQHLSDGLNSGIALKRRIIEDLRPSSLSNLGLVAALEILVREWGQRNELEVDSDLQPVHLAPTGELTVYRLVQEALTNISKYAKARNVRLRLDADDGEVRVAVSDDGIGFDPLAQRNSAHGLLGMRYRLESENGRLELRSAPGKGTTIEAYLPESVDAPAPASEELLPG